MASYGWTLDEALALTYPQVQLLYRTLKRYPTVNMLAAGLGQEAGVEGALDRLGESVDKMDPAVARRLRQEIEGGG